MIQRIIKSSGFVSDNFHNKPTMSRTVIIRQLTFSEITSPQKVSLEVEHWSPRSKATSTAARTSPHCEDSSNLRHSSKIRHDKAEVQACRCQIRLQILDSERYCAALNPFILLFAQVMLNANLPSISISPSKLVTTTEQNEYLTCVRLNADRKKIDSSETSLDCLFSSLSNL